MNALGLSFLLSPLQLCAGGGDFRARFIPGGRSAGRFAAEICLAFPPPVTPFHVICALIAIEPRDGFGAAGSRLERYCFIAAFHVGRQVC